MAFPASESEHVYFEELTGYDHKTSRRKPLQTTSPSTKVRLEPLESQVYSRQRLLSSKIEGIESILAKRYCRITVYDCAARG
jgi:hypothetical protein